MKQTDRPVTGDAAVCRSTLGLFAAIAAACLMLFSGIALAQGPDPDRYIVKFKDGQVAQGLAAVLGASGELLLELQPQNAVAARLPAQALAGLESNPHIEYIERDPPRYPMAEITPYGIPMVQADPFGTDAERLGPGSEPRKVCVIDSGYDLGHPDLPTSGASGHPSDWSTDGCGHGTHVAGTIVALAGNNEGVVGVFGKGPVSTFNVKVFGDNCSWSYASSLVDAANQCRQAGAHVINMSLGCIDSRGGPVWSCSSSTEDAAFQDLYDNHNILSVSSAGNSGNSNYGYPASYASVISVAAVDENRVVADFSQKNDRVELAAPGVGVLSTVPRGMGYNVTVAVGNDGYEAAAMQGSPSGSETGPLVDCGLGTSICPGPENGGQVCLIARGEITFDAKTKACQDGGGVAAIIYNHEPGMLFGTLGDNPQSSILSVGVSDASGAELSGRLGSDATVTVEPGDYDYYSGTSMASPHVAGVAALVWSHFPGLSNKDLREALQVSADHPEGVSKDNAYGYGIVQAKAAYTLLAGNGGGGEEPVNQPPTASFTYDCTELACSFDGRGSTDPDGTIVGYSWDFGDGATATGSTADHTYGTDGSYTVTLTVTDDDGATGTDSQTVTVAGDDDGGGGEEPADISLSASAYKVRGLQKADLFWSGASSSVDINRDGGVIATDVSGSTFTDHIDVRGGGSYTYQVCEAGTSTCSNTVTVTF
jgi:serine protease